MKISDSEIVKKIQQKKDLYISGFKNLPHKKQKIISLFVFVILIIALPLFVLTVTKTKTSIFNKAASGEATGERTPSPYPVTPTPIVITPSPIGIGCIRKAQNVSINPSTNNVTINPTLPGGSGPTPRPVVPATYTITIANNDLQECSASTFLISVIVPNSLFYPSLSATQVILSPGESSNVTISLLPAMGVSQGVYPIGVSVTGPNDTITAYANLNVSLYTFTPTPVPATPSPTPKPSPTAIPNSSPTITTIFLPIGRVKKSYKATVTGYDVNPKDKLSMKVSGLPDGIKLGSCVLSSNSKTVNITCQITGIAKKWGFYGLDVSISDTHTQSTKSVPLLILPF